MDFKKRINYLTIVILLFAISSCKNESQTNLKKEIEKQVEIIKKSKKYSDFAVEKMNIDDSLIVSQNKIDLYVDLLEKSLIEAKKVDTSVLNKIKKDYGKFYSEKYIKGMELQVQSYKKPNNKNLIKGQILYDEYVDWINATFNE